MVVAIDEYPSSPGSNIAAFFCVAAESVATCCNIAASAVACPFLSVSISDRSAAISPDWLGWQAQSPATHKITIICFIRRCSPGGPEALGLIAFFVALRLFFGPSLATFNEGSGVAPAVVRVIYVIVLCPPIACFMA